MGDDIINWLFASESTIKSLKSLNDKMRITSKNDYAKQLTRAINETGDLWLAVGMGVTFSPNTGQPLFMDLPFNFKEDGSYEKNELVWRLWDNNLQKLVAQHKKNLELYTYYSMDVGYYDQIGFNIKAVKKLSIYMTKENIQHSAYFYDGDHYNKFDENLEYRIMPQMSIYLKGEQ